MSSDAQPAMLLGEGDSYDGVILDPSQLPDSPEQFKSNLEYSIETWKVSKRRGIWLKIPTPKANLIPIAASHGFEFHSAEPGWVLLTRWLPQTENKLPPGASHQVGVGAFVLNEHRQILMVQEKTGPAGGGRQIWKLPTGLVQTGEDITEAAQREVMEETGIEATFQSLLLMRQSHAWTSAGKSDMFFVLALHPSPGQADSIKIQEDEIAAAKWMDLEEFKNNSFMLSRPMLKQIMDVCNRYVENGGRGGLVGRRLASGRRSGRDDLLFWGEEERGVGGGKEDDMWIGFDGKKSDQSKY
jgi:ADP-ribose pyrophosphatase YjhB (NUDIX family)